MAGTENLRIRPAGDLFGSAVQESGVAAVRQQVAEAIRRILDEDRAGKRVGHDFQQFIGIAELPFPLPQVRHLLNAADNPALPFLRDPAGAGLQPEITHAPLAGAERDFNFRTPSLRQLLPGGFKGSEILRIYPLRRGNRL